MPMRKLISCIAALAMMTALTACGNNDSSVSQAEKTASAVTETKASETAEASETSAPPKYDYVHGDDGYYCITDEMPDRKWKTQSRGTCWLHACCASMETEYFKENGSYIHLKPMDLVNVIYGDDKEEGFFPKKGFDKYDMGGWQWMVTETLSRGFDDLTIDSSIILDETDRDAVKKNLHERGAVAIGMLDLDDSKKGIFGSYFTMNDTENKEFDHDITIVGYDDHFPKEYFKEPAAEDGAWLTYNSSFSGDMLYYVSYCTPIQYAISHSVTDKYSEVLSYDAGNEQDKYIKTGDSTKTANVFHKAGKLAAIGTYNDLDSQDIKIEIYDADFNEVLYSQDAVLDYHGYHTIELDDPVDVTDYAVAVTYSKVAPVEGETIDYGDTDYKTVSEKGQSFVYTENGWKDMTDDDIKKVLGIDFEPNNCCIKALYAD